MDEFQRWFQDKGDQTLRVDYSLTHRSLIIDAGAYKGSWAKTMAYRYDCKILAYEPVKAFYDAAKALLQPYGKAKIFHYGVGATTQQLSIGLNDNASSVYDISGETESIKLRGIKEIMTNDVKRQVDLFKINIEGGEYDLLETILDNDMISSFNNLQIQFHNFSFVRDPVARRDKIRERLAKTHKLTYEYTWVWENWCRI